MTFLRTPTHREPTHPGEVLFEEFLSPLNLTQADVAERIGVSYPRLNELIHGKRGVTTDTALRLSKLLGTTPEFWLNLQLTYDLYQAQHSSEANEIRHIKPLAYAHAGR